MEIIGQERRRRTRTHRVPWMALLGFQGFGQGWSSNCLLGLLAAPGFGLTGSSCDPHAVHPLSLKELHLVWLPSPRDLVLLLLPPRTLLLDSAGNKWLIRDVLS